MSSRYTIDIDALPIELVQRCREALKYRWAVIRFIPHGGDKLGRTEKKLKDLDLVKECRTVLKTAARTTVYFKGERVSHPRINPAKEAARVLLTAGHSTQAVADALGRSRFTVVRWHKSNRPRGGGGHVDPIDDQEALRSGLEALLTKAGIPTPPRYYRKAKGELAEHFKSSVEQIEKRALAAGAAIKDLERMASDVRTELEPPFVEAEECAVTTKRPCKEDDRCNRECRLLGATKAKMSGTGAWIHLTLERGMRVVKNTKTARQVLQKRGLLS